MHIYLGKSVGIETKLIVTNLYYVQITVSDYYFLLKGIRSLKNWQIFEISKQMCKTILVYFDISESKEKLLELYQKDSGSILNKLHWTIMVQFHHKKNYN